MRQHSRNGTLSTDVEVSSAVALSRVTMWNIPPMGVMMWCGAGRERDLKIVYVFSGVNVDAITLHMKLLSIESDFSHWPYEPVYDVLRFIQETQHHA